jgi:hypothetical protein
MRERGGQTIVVRGRLPTLFFLNPYHVSQYVSSIYVKTIVAAGLESASS